MMAYQSINPKSIQKSPELNKSLKQTSSDHIDTKLQFVRPYSVAYLDQTFRAYIKEKEVTLIPWNRKELNVIL